MKPSLDLVSVVDPRIDPQPDPVYVRTIAPKQNQYYSIPASALSDSYIAFNNLTTLGTDRAYLDTFELEITAQISFDLHTGATVNLPSPEQWTFDSFPFNKCCEQARININGGAFFSQPLSYLRAKERYWDERKINDSYANICPCNKPRMQDENGCNGAVSTSVAPPSYINNALNVYQLVSGTLVPTSAMPTRLGYSSVYFSKTASGMSGAPNNAIVGQYDPSASTLTVTWREPIFASPFSSRVDETFGRPLYNITSIDLAFNMQDLGNMIRLMNINAVGFQADAVNIHLTSVNLRYQVMTIPPGMTPPSYTVVPYRKIDPYITNCSENGSIPYTQGPANTLSSKVTMKSGVYTLNEIPQAIWVFAGPTKDVLQLNNPNGTIPATSSINLSQWSNNKLFGFLDGISISLANTTQILNTAKVQDLYRIAKENGCQDSFNDWGRPSPLNPRNQNDGYLCPGPGSVLRLIPGKDIVLEGQELIPGSNANNMVLQVEAEFILPANLLYAQSWALWLLFEYNGVATIRPGMCEITLNPINSMVRDRGVVPASTADAAPPTAEGSGFIDKIKSAIKYLRDNKVISKALGLASGIGSVIPPAAGIGAALGTAGNIASSLGFGERGVKRLRGGAVMGLGDFM